MERDEAELEDLIAANGGATQSGAAFRTPPRGGFESARSASARSARLGDGTERSDASDLDAEMQELQLVRDALKDEEAALAGITIEPARMLGIDHRVGTLEVGKDCDLVITDGDILHYETFVQLAVVDGKVVYDKQEELFFAHIRPRSEGALAPVERVDPGEEEVADSGEDEGGDEDDD